MGPPAATGQRPRKLSVQITAFRQSQRRSCGAWSDEHVARQGQNTNHIVRLVNTLPLIEIRPYRGGWQCFEGDGVAPYFVETDAKRAAMDYATQRMRGRTGEIRVTDSAGNAEQ